MSEKPGNYRSGRKPNRDPSKLDRYGLTEYESAGLYYTHEEYHEIIRKLKQRIDELQGESDAPRTTAGLR